MAERRHPELDAGRADSPIAWAERYPANDLYDHAFSLLEAAQGLRAAATAWRSAPALAASLGCIEAALHELRDAVPDLRETALTTHGRASAGEAVGERDQGENGTAPDRVGCA